MSIVFYSSWACSTNPIVKWSCRLAPTFGLSIFTSISFSSSNSFGPIPLNWRICGVFYAPADKINSKLQKMFSVIPIEFSTSTPIATLSLNKILLTKWFVLIYKFDLASTSGVRNASDKLCLSPLATLIWFYPIPSFCYFSELKSSEIGRFHASEKAFMMLFETGHFGLSLIFHSPSNPWKLPFILSIGRNCLSDFLK